MIYTDTPIAFHPILNRNLLPYLPPIRTRSHSRLPRPVRNNPLPHPTHARAIRQKTAPRTGDMGVYARCSFRCGTYAPLLGCTRTPAMIAFPQQIDLECFYCLG